MFSAPRRQQSTPHAGAGRPPRRALAGGRTVQSGARLLQSGGRAAAPGPAPSHAYFEIVRQLTSVAALAAFDALGFVDVRNCALDLPALAALRDVHIARLDARGNAALVDAQGEGGRRRRLIFLLPRVWVLDDQVRSARHTCSLPA